MPKNRRPDPQGNEYEEAFASLPEHVDEQLPGILQEVDGAAALLAEIFGTPEPERKALLGSGVRFRSLQLCQLLEERSRAVWFSAPARAVQLADLAVVVAESRSTSPFSTCIEARPRPSRISPPRCGQSSNPETCTRRRWPQSSSSSKPRKPSRSPAHCSIR